MRKKRNILSLIGLIIILILGPLVYFGLLRPHKSTAAWFNDGWHYRKAVNITKKSAYADLVHLTDLLIDWPDNLSGRVPNNIDNVKRQSKIKFGVDSPGVASPVNKSPHEPSTNSSEKANGKIWREPEYSSKSTFAEASADILPAEPTPYLLFQKVIYNTMV